MTSQNLPQLSDGNYSNWKFRVDCILSEKDVKEVTEIEISEDLLESLEVDKKKNLLTKDAKAKSIIVQCITDRHLEYVKDCKTSYEMFTALRNIFERKSVLSKLYIRRKLLTLKCDEETNLQDYFVKFDGLIRDLEATGTKLDEDDKVSHLLLTMPKRYDTVITVLETTTTNLTLDYVKSKLLDVELKLKNNSIVSHVSDCSFNVNVGNKSKPRCYICGSTMHFQAKCPKNRNFNGNRSFRGKASNSRGNCHGKSNHKNNQSSINQASIANEDPNSLTFIALSSSIETRSKSNSINFILDSGATNNLVCADVEEHMSEVKEIPPVTFKVANGQTMIAKKQGRLNVVCTSNSMKNVTIDALIVECLPFNLLSVQRINKAGCKVIFEEGSAKICKQDNVLIYCNFVNNLYVATFNFANCNAMAVTNENMWHLRLGHLNRRGLQLLGLPYSNNPCDSCKKGKATRVPFKSVDKPRSNRVGELLHTDVWGPVTTPTKDGERYYVTITDDYSHFTFLYLLKYKSEATEKVKLVVEQLKAQNIRVSRLRSDNGGEYSSNAFKMYCQENGIRQEFSAPYTPQQCGLSERLNRTILDKVRSMFVDTNLPKHLWGEAVRCAIYQINRSPTRALSGKVPAHCFPGANTDLNKLKVFGSKVWVFNLPKQSKLEPRATEMRMVGYTGSGYRLWNPTTDTIVLSRDVTFDESDIWYESRKELSSQVPVQQFYDEEPGEDKTMQDGNSDGIVNGSQDEIQSDQRKSTRTVKVPTRYDEFEMYIAYCLITTDNDPVTYKEAMESGVEWKTAITNELQALEKFKTWTEAELPKGKKAIETKWVFRTKQDGVKKARLVAKGFQENTDSNCYAPVAKMSTVRLTISHALQHDWELRQLDVPSGFLNGTLQEEIYIKVPEGVTNVSNGNVLRLNRALYGLREAPRCWNECFDKFAKNNGLKRSLNDVCLYVGENVWLTLFVDDCIVTGEPKNIDKLVNELKQEFNVKDLGKLENFLGINVTRHENHVYLSQEKLIEKILDRFNMSDCKTKATPMEAHFQPDSSETLHNVPYRELIGSINYLSMTTRPDICFAASFLGKYLDTPNVSVWKAAKRVLQYLKGTKDTCLTFMKHETHEKLLAFADADWGGDKVDRKSVSGMAIFHHGNLVSWTCKKQQVVALSTAEAEYIAAAYCTAELLYLKGLIQDFTCEEVTATLNVDNQSAIAMIKNYENTKRSKHIDIKVHFIKDIVAKNLVKVSYVPTNENVADVFTKALGKEKYVIFVKSLGMTKRPK